MSSNLGKITRLHGFQTLQAHSLNSRPPTLVLSKNSTSADASAGRCESRAKPPRDHGELGRIDLGEPVVRLHNKPRRRPTVTTAHRWIFGAIAIVGVYIALVLMGVSR